MPLCLCLSPILSSLPCTCVMPALPLHPPERHQGPTLQRPVGHARAAKDSVLRQRSPRAHRGAAAPRAVRADPPGSSPDPQAHVVLCQQGSSGPWPCSSPAQGPCPGTTPVGRRHGFAGGVTEVQRAPHWASFQAHSRHSQAPAHPHQGHKPAPASLAHLP